MRWLLFLSRLTLICGLFFALSLSELIHPWIGDDAAVSTVVTIGYFMGMIIVPVTLFSYLVVWLAGRKPAKHVPRWLIVANVFVLLLLAGYIVYVNFFHAQPAL